MRTLSAARAKGNNRGVTELRPREGTQLRAVYDQLMANKGVPVELDMSKVMRKAVVVRLTDFYGLDIRTINRSDGHKRIPALYLLAGEWFGMTYVDYVADRINKSKRG